MAVSGNQEDGADMSLRKRKKTQLDQALDQARGRASELVERAAPHVEQARDRLVEDYLPAAQDAVSTARETARETMKDTVLPAAAAAMAQAGEKLTDLGEQTGRKPKRSRFKKLLAAAGVVGIGAAVAKALKGRQGGSTAYTPVPSPAPTPASPPPTPPTPDPEAPMAMTPQESAFEPAAAEAPADEAGSGFDEALADEQEHPHAVTTPDDPAETVEVSKGKKA